MQCLMLMVLTNNSIRLVSECQENSVRSEIERNEANELKKKSKKMKAKQSKENGRVCTIVERSQNNWPRARTSRR